MIGGGVPHVSATPEGPRTLFLDDAGLAWRRGAVLRPHKAEKHPANPLIVREKGKGSTVVDVKILLTVPE